MLPNFDELNLTDESIWYGFYTLGLIKKYRPDIELIPFRLARHDQWTEQDRRAECLRIEIDRALCNGHKVMLVPWEEDYMGQREDAYTELFNAYKDDEFYFVSEMDQQGQLIFRDYHGLQCKILELPFLLVNDCITYASIRARLQIRSAPVSAHNYLCMIGRPEKHKFDLAVCLGDHGLDTAGLITTMQSVASPGFRSQVNLVTPKYSVSTLETVYRCAAAQIKVKDIWASSNVENFLHIEQTYDMPLIINPESTMGIFPATEKSIWPALMARMYLIQAQAGGMRYIQRFHDVDQSRWANLEFDSVYGWDDHAHQCRRTRMIADNAELIKTARERYQDIRQDLELSRWTLVKNFYEFFTQQIQTV